MNVHVLERLDSAFIPAVSDEVRVFCVVKNEIDRMAYILTYYRQLGANRFFFIDNNSTDGTSAFLCAQTDCHVFTTAASYADSVSGIIWTKHLLDKYGLNHWCLIIDADELFVYPNSESIQLPELCKFLDHEETDTIFTFLLDMYPSGSIEKAKCIPNQPFYEICPYFDKDYSFVDRIYLKGNPPFPPKEVIGGPRVRCFYPRFQGQNSVAVRFLTHIIERGSLFLRKLKIPFPFIRLKSTPLFKIPLIKWKLGYAYTASTHILNQPVKISSVTGAILHFKFFSDFHERVVDAVKSNQHSQGSAEYKRYLSRMEKVGNLMYEGSRKYNSTSDLLNEGLMHSTPDYEKFIKRKS